MDSSVLSYILYTSDNLGAGVEVHEGDDRVVHFTDDCAHAHKLRVETTDARRKTFYYGWQH